MPIQPIGFTAQPYGQVPKVPMKGHVAFERHDLLVTKSPISSHLLKQSRKHPLKWHSRYFEWTGSTLSYGVGPDALPHLTVDLCDIQSVEKATGDRLKNLGKKWALTLQYFAQGTCEMHDLVISAHSNQELDRWFVTLKRALNGRWAALMSSCLLQSQIKGASKNMDAPAQTLKEEATIAAPTNSTAFANLPPLPPKVTVNEATALTLPDDALLNTRSRQKCNSDVTITSDASSTTIQRAVTQSSREVSQPVRVPHSLLSFLTGLYDKRPSKDSNETYHATSVRSDEHRDNGLDGLSTLAFGAGEKPRTPQLQANHDKQNAPMAYLSKQTHSTKDLSFIVGMYQQDDLSAPHAPSTTVPNSKASSLRLVIPPGIRHEYYSIIERISSMQVPLSPLHAEPAVEIDDANSSLANETSISSMLPSSTGAQPSSASNTLNELLTPIFQQLNITFSVLNNNEQQACTGNELNQHLRNCVASGLTVYEELAKQPKEQVTFLEEGLLLDLQHSLQRLTVQALAILNEPGPSAAQRDALVKSLVLLKTHCLRINELFWIK